MGEQMQQREVTFDLVGTEFVNHETGVKIVPVGTGWRAAWVTQDGTQIGINVWRQDYDDAKHDARGYIINVERFWRAKYHVEALEIDAKRDARMEWTKVGRKHWRHDETGIEISKADGQWDVYPLTKMYGGFNSVTRSWRAWLTRAEAIEAANRVEIPAALKLIRSDEEDAYAEAKARLVGRIFDVPHEHLLPPLLVAPQVRSSGQQMGRMIREAADSIEIGTATYGVYEREQRPEAVIAPQLHGASPSQSLLSDGAVKALRHLRDSVLPGWVSGYIENEEGMGHRGIPSPEEVVFVSADIRRMIDDAAHELGVEL